ncbi:N-terminal domain of NEFA-interacting nuclear protein NIP30-domain-containing protein [Circinella umbellata]|nr:N-terminal domain of NEFA-interacting nuclear protein NIP30-domain-containing protein [Circinella umbellata]
MKFVSRSIVDQNQEKEIPKEGDQEVGDSSNTTAQEEYDPRTLYERLQEQKNIKEELFQEQTRFSNLIKRVDDEEAEYYQTLSDVQERLNLEKAQKERDELEAFRKAVEETRHTQPTVDTVGTITNTDTTTTATTKSSSSSSSSATQKPGRRRSSKNALEGLVVVKKKRTGDEKDEADKDDKKEDEHQAKKVKPNTTAAATTDSKKTADISSSSGSKTGLSTLMAAYSSDSESDDE